MKDKIIRELSNNGIEIGACKQGVAELEHSASDVETLAGLFFKNAHFCLNNGFPTAGWIVDHFGGESAKYGIFCRENADISNVRRAAVLADIKVTAKYDNYSVGKIYAKGHSAIDVAVCGHARIFIDAFDDVVVNVDASGDSHVYINQYGNATIRYDKSDNAVVKVNVKHSNIY